MIKVGEVSLKKDKENLKSYDLVFVPGVNEYNLEKDNINEKPSKDKAKGLPPPPFCVNFEEEMNQKKPERLMTHETMEDGMKSYVPSSENNCLIEILRIIKHKMNNGIIVFSVDNYKYI